MIKKGQTMKSHFTQDAYSLELADKMRSLFTRTKLPMWILVEHRCPTCGKAYTNPLEVEFLDLNGECSGCDHVRSDIGYEKEVQE